MPRQAGGQEAADGRVGVAGIERALLPFLGQHRGELAARGAGADGDGEVGGVVGDDAGRRAHERDVVAGRRGPTHLPVGAAADRRDDPRPGDRGAQLLDVGERGHQIHAPSGTRCSSPQRLPRGRILRGFARPDGSNASRSRACASRSSGL